MQNMLSIVFFRYDQIQYDDILNICAYMYVSNDCLYIYIYIDIQYPLFISKSMYMNIFVNYISTFKREKGVYVYISIYYATTIYI